MNDIAGRLAEEARGASHGYLRPRDAATLIIVDRTGSEPRVLLGRRHERHVFMPGKFVFPGGRVDPDDATTPAADDLHPAVSEQLLRSLGSRASAARVRAFALAALRETYEEAGLLIGLPGRGALGPAWDAFTERGLLPALGGLCCVARAVTPPGRPRRFDTRFFAVDASAITHRLPEGTGPSGELDGLAWLTFDEALKVDMPAITELVLGDLKTALESGLAPGLDAPCYRMLHGKFVRELI